MNWKSIADKIKRAAKGIPKTKTNEVINKELDDLLNSTNEKIINKTKDIIENQIPKVMGTDNIKNTVNKTNETVNTIKRRKGNREIKKIPINNSTQQEQQLLLEAPKQKNPRKPRREYKSNLGTNTKPIQLPGPVNKEKKALSLKKGEGDLFNTLKKKASYNVQKGNFGHDPIYNISKPNGKPVGEVYKNKFYKSKKNKVKDDVQKTDTSSLKKEINTKKEQVSQPESSVEPAPQSKPEPKNNKVDVSIDDFKPADELEQMDLTDSNDIDVSHLFEESDTIKDSQLDKLEELRENGTLSQEEYEKAIDNVVNDSNMNIETDSPIMSEPEVNDQPKKKQSRRQQRKEENLKNNRQQTSTQEQQINNRKQIDVTDTIKNESEKVEEEVQKNQQQIFNEYAEQNFKPLEVSDGDLSVFKTGDGYDVTLRNARAENITFNDTSYDVLYDENGARVFRNTQTGDFVQDQKLANSLNSIGEQERNR